MDSDFNPAEHRSPEQLKISNFAVLMHLVKAAAGSGIFFLPYAFKRAGYVSAIICSAFVGLMYVHTSVVMIRCSQELCKRTRQPALTYAQTAAAAFKLGPKPLQNFAEYFAIATNTIICFVQYQTSIVYMLYATMSIKQLLSYFFDWHWNVETYILLSLPLFCLLAMAPSLNFLVPFSIVGTIFLISGLIVTFSYFFTDMPSPSRLPTYTGAEQISIYCGIFLYAIFNMGVVMPLENTMRNPTDLPLIFASAVGIMVLVSQAFGFFGFNKYSDPCTSVIMNLPLDEFPSQIVKITVTISVVFTFGLQYFVPVSILWPKVAEIVGDHIATYVGFRIMGVCLCALVSTLFPHLAQMLGLLAAVSMGTLMLLLPIIIETTTKWNDPGTFKHYFIIVKNVLIFFLWCNVMYFGIHDNLRDIHKVKMHIKGVESRNPICQ